MDGYCVIQFQSKGEKTKVLGFLVETESKFSVTTDLKEYLTEKFKVKIIDCIDMKDQSTNTIEEIERITEETVDQGVVVTPATINDTIEQPPPPSPSNDVAPSSSIVPFQEREVKREVVVISSESVTIDQTPLENDNQFQELIAAVIKDEPREEAVFVDVAPAIDYHNDTLPIDQTFEFGFDSFVDHQFDDVGAYEPVVEGHVVETSYNDFQQTPSLETLVVRDSGMEVNMEVNDQSRASQQNVIATITIKPEAVNNVANVVPIIDPPTIDNNMDTHIADIQPPNDTGDPSVEDRAHQQPYLSYLKSSITPKREVLVRKRVEMEEKVENEDNKFEMDEDKDDINLALDVDAPGDVQSTSRRSGRVTKRPKYATDDESDDEPPTKSQRKYTPRAEKSEECQKCGALQKGYVQKIEHMMVHANMMKYECMVNGCKYKAADRRYIAAHMKTMHEEQPNHYKQIQFTREQTDELNEMMKECFLETSVKNKNSCHICNQSIGWNGSVSAFYQREHALQHLDFMLYTCMEQGCQFESKSERSMKCHRKCHGDGASRVMAKVDLTKEQEEEIEEMVSKCFPANNTNCDD